MGSKIKIEEIRQDIESHNWHLISKTYTNLKTPLELECPQGHQVDITYGDWRKAQTHECPICVRQATKKLNEKISKKKGYRILGLDQSTHISGWALFEDNNLLAYGKWESKAEHTTTRISEVKSWLDHKIQETKPDEVILEDIQLQKFGQGEEAVLTYKKLAHLQGVLKNYLYENGIPYKIVFPSTWRTLSQIKGKTRTEKKKSAQIKVEELYGISVPVDCAEAILIGKWGVNDHKSNDMIIF